MHRLKSTLIIILLEFILVSVTPLSGQNNINVSQIKEQIENYKKDSRGPYYRIKWYCTDGTIRAAKDPCPEGVGGIQHASLKPEVEKLAKNHHIFLSNLLSSVDYTDFWDVPNNHSRLKQYQIVKYLSSVDDGWVYRRGRYYRGAMQAEDEETWGKAFYQKLLKDGAVTESNYYLVKQSLKDIPHKGDNNLAQLMRSQSKVLAEEVPEFMKLRIKIHGNPDKTDIASVNSFLSKHKADLTSDQVKRFNELLQTMKDYYTPLSIKKLSQKINGIKSNSKLKSDVLALLSEYDKEQSTDVKVKILTQIIIKIRTEMQSIDNANDRLILLDLSNKFENTLFIKSQEWKPENLKELLQKIQTLSAATMGSGLIEIWEWKSVSDVLTNPNLPSSMTLKELERFLIASRGIVEWSTAMVKAVYEKDAKQFNTFEPKSMQFIDDRIRSSVILDLGNSVSQLGEIIAKHSAIKNDVLGVAEESTIRGLNPGYAFGELVVVQEQSGNIEFSKDKIYVFERPTSGLKPVAGIMTVSEGNLVSHVQLLARNLGIPNATLSGKSLQSLLKYNGKKVFYAVANKGNVIMKLEKDMTKKEKALFSKAQRNTNKIKVPVDRIQLEQTDVLNLRNVKADDSGKICGPKAANLGQLKSIFPDHVVEGFVIPFGIFRKHLDNEMPGTNTTYWNYLNDTYAKANEMRKTNKSDDEIDAYQLKRLRILKKAVEQMKLNDDFVAQIENEFKKVFGTTLGKKAVFLRSDTNMEDLKEFTGAGLNLTLFNVLSKEEILNGIKEVWASPYTERSLRWRQKYLLNPEYVFPSIVVIPGVNNDYSGVVITQGINEGEKDDITVAFSHGVGGAVDGQAAETRLLTKNSNKLLSPSREPEYVYLPESGDTKIGYTTFEKPILNEQNMNTIRELVKNVRVKVPKRTDPDYKGAYDMEMGFMNNKLWLFQIRPFVENKKAKSSDYLKSISPTINYKKKISLTEKI